MENVKDWLIENSEIKYKEFSDNLVKSKYQLLGIRLPKLREKARLLAKEYGLKGVEVIGEDYFESIMLQGFVIGYAKAPINEKEEAIYQYLLKADNWSHIDSFTTTFKFNKKEYTLWWQFINKLKNDEHEFVKRFVLVSMLKYLKDEYIDNVLDYCRLLTNQPYNVEMANGWLLATAYIDYPEKVIDIINDLDLNTYRYTKRKIHDSFRISDENKRKFDEVRYLCG